MTVKQYPFYLKATVILIGLYYLVTILNVLNGIWIPFAFAILFAVLLNPLYNRLLSWKFPRPLGVLLFVDSNIIFPRFVSVKVQINALISLVAVFLGNMMWGIPGMFLMLPMVAVLKIIFDRVDDLKPWGKLLGDEVPIHHMGQVWGRSGRRNKTIGADVDLKPAIKK